MIRLMNVSTLVACLVLLQQGAHASFIVEVGNNPQPNQENVLLNNGQVGMSIQGTTNQTSTDVLFESASQFIADPSSGQARVEARAANDINSAQIAVDDEIAVSLADPTLGFGSMIFNAFIGGGLGDGGSLSLVVEGVDANDNSINETFIMASNGDPLSLGNGSNFFTITAEGGKLIKSVGIVPGANSSYADLRQVRLGGIVPEPGTLALLLPAAAILLAIKLRWSR